MAVAALAMVATLPGRTHGLGLITEPLLRDLNLGRVTYGSINLWATLLGAACCLPCGWLLDRLGVPGDVAIFGGFTPHRSAPNRSSRWRRQLDLSYNEHFDGGKQRDRHYAEFHAWLRTKYAEHGKTDVYFE